MTPYNYSNLIDCLVFLSNGKKPPIFGKVGRIIIEYDNCYKTENNQDHTSFNVCWKRKSNGVVIDWFLSVKDFA